MTDWVRRALTRKMRGKTEANEKLILLVKFGIGMTVCLTGLEIAHLVVLRVWSSEVFAAITGLIGTVTGVLIGHRA